MLEDTWIVINTAHKITPMVDVPERYNHILRRSIDLLLLTLIRIRNQPDSYPSKLELVLQRPHSPGRTTFVC